MREMQAHNPWHKMPLEEQVWLLSMVEVFDPLSKEELEELGRRAPDTYLERGALLYGPENHSEKLFVLKRGRVRVYEVDDEGREVTLSVVEGGNLLGEMALTGQRLTNVYVRALEPSIVCSLRRTDLERIILGKPEVGMRLLRWMSERLRQTEIHLGEMIRKGVAARLASQILRFVESEGVVTGQGRYKIPTRYTHEQLATLIGSKRAPVTRAFSELKEAGAVEQRDRQIHVTDLEALKRVAEVD